MSLIAFPLHTMHNIPFQSCPFFPHSLGTVNTIQEMQRQSEHDAKASSTSMAADIATRLQALCDTFTADLIQATADAKAATAVAVSALETRLVALDHAVNMIREAEQRTYTTVIDAKNATAALSADVDRQLQSLRQSWTEDLVQSTHTAASEVEGRLKPIDDALVVMQQAHERVEEEIHASSAALSDDIEKSIALLRNELTRSSVANSTRFDERLQVIDHAIAAAQQAYRQSTRDMEVSLSATMADVDTRLQALDRALASMQTAHQQAAADASSSTAALAADIENRVAVLRAAWTSELATATDTSAAAVEGRLASIDAAVRELREAQHQAEARYVTTAATFAADVETRLQTLRALLSAETAASSAALSDDIEKSIALLRNELTRSSVANSTRFDERLQVIDHAIAAAQQAYRQSTRDMEVSLSATMADVDTRLQALDRALASMQTAHQQAAADASSSTAALAADIENRVTSAVDGVLAAQHQADINTKSSVADLADDLDRRLKAIDGVIAAVQESQSADYAKVLQILSYI